MRTILAAATVLLLLPLASVAPAAPPPALPDPGAPCDPPACVPWINGNFDLLDGSPGFGWTVIPGGGASVVDVDGDGDREALIQNGPGIDPTGPRLVKYLYQPPLPGDIDLRFRVEAPAGTDCGFHYDIRVILLGALDPLPFLDTVNDLSPLLPLDFYNDEVLAWASWTHGGVIRGGDEVRLDPLRGTVYNHPDWASYTDTERQVWLAQHVLAIWVLYLLPEGPAGCALDDFVRILEA